MVCQIFPGRTDYWSAAWEASHRVVSERYRYLYDRAELADWTARIERITSRMSASGSFPDMAHARQGVHFVFNNCHANYGTTNADEITALLIEFDRMRRLSDAPPEACTAGNEDPGLSV